ncbi:hypothetical protein JMM81_11785 [Bacillus sp. V3B]|uniref:hypothetical protein n=1 Tax=Bacillus sp. V3B TaxID=2804915 RepID=UPI002108A395|nr:hypothetical protein [Bacillus sp. V3B]MCQ6275639.1 hypothetical protein [Bacillus sp. V3B]
MNAKSSLIQWGFKPRLNEVKPPADASDFLKVIYRASSIKIRVQIRRGEFDWNHIPKVIGASTRLFICMAKIELLTT